MPYRFAIPLITVLFGLLLASAHPSTVPVANAAVSCSFGCMDMPFYYKPPSASQPLVQTPTGEKPQSKLWYNDGYWWGSLFNNVAGNYRIYRLDWLTQVWQDTGTVLDSRPESKADVLWDGTYLYVASGGGFDLTGAGTRKALDAVLFRYSYNPATKGYAKDFGPVTIRTGGAETLVLDKDTTGKLWITYTQNSKVYVNHSRASDSDWSPAAAMVVPTPSASWTSLSPDDISTLVAFNGKIGVLWSNESSGQFSGSSDTAFYFAYHVDGAADTAWTAAPIYRQPAAADDHINIKSLQTDPSGNVYVMVKTSYNTLGSPQLLLIVGKKQSTGYSWTPYVESYRQDGQTRPLLLLDSENRKLYVFTSDEGGGNIYYKSTSMDNIQFASGAGTIFMTAGGYALNNLTSTKQAVNGATGIVVMASHDNEAKIDSSAADYYFHNYITLPGTGPTPTPKPTATATPKPTATVPPPTIVPGGGSDRVYVPLVER